MDMDLSLDLEKNEKDKIIQLTKLQDRKVQMLIIECQNEIVNKNIEDFLEEKEEKWDNYIKYLKTLKSEYQIENEAIFQNPCKELLERKISILT